MEWGLAQGLSQSGQYDQQIQGLRYKQYADQQARGEAEMRAKAFAQDFDFEQGMNPYDDPRAKEFAYQKLNELKDVYKNNPNAAYDPIAQIEIQKIKKEIKQNPIISRGLQVKQAYQQYLKDRSEAQNNPYGFDEEEWNWRGAQFENYFKTGHPLGEQGKTNEGERPVIYTKPKAWEDIDGIGLKLGNQFHDMEFIKGKAPGEYHTRPKESSLNALVDTFYNDNKAQLDTIARKRGVPSGRDIAKSVINSGIKTDYDPGDPTKLWDLALRQQQLDLDKSKLKPQGGASPWQQFTQKTAGQLSSEDVRNIWGDHPHIRVNGVDLTAYRWEPDGRFVNKNGIPYLFGQVKVPLEAAYRQGLIDGEDEDARIKDNFIGKAKFEKVDDGKGGTKQWVTVTHLLPVDPNSQYHQQKFDTRVQPDKLVNPPFQQKKVAPSGAMKDSAGNVYDASGNYIGHESEF